MKPVWSLEQLCELLKIEPLPEPFAQVYEEAVAMYQQGLPLLEPDNFRKLNETYGLFRKYTDVILQAGAQLARNEPLQLFVCLLNRAAVRFGRNGPALTDETMPQTEDPVQSLACAFAPLYALLPTVERSVARMREHKVPESVIQATLGQYEGCITLVELRFGKIGYIPVYYNWMLLTVAGKILRIGRLQYEMFDSFSGPVQAFRNQAGQIRLLAHQITAHPSGVGIGYPGQPETQDAFFCQVTETDAGFTGYPVGEDGYICREQITLPKADWELFLRAGDPVLSVHIPRGDSLPMEECLASIQEAKEIFQTCYPEFAYRAMFCHSWMLDPQLDGLLRPNSNILSFAHLFARYPYENSSTTAVFMFVFLHMYDRYEDLPENTSLMRTLKKHYLDGGVIYQGGGILSV